MTSLTLRGGNRHTIVAENLSYSLSLATITDLSRSSMRIYITNLLNINSALLKTKFQRTGWTCHIRRRDMIAIAREAPSYDLCNDRSATTNSTFVIFNNQRGCTTAWYQSVTILIKRTTGLCGIIVVAESKRLDTIERGNTIHISLLSTTANHTVL